MKKMTNNERNNKRKMNAALVFVWALGLFTAHTLTKLYYKKELNTDDTTSEINEA